MAIDLGKAYVQIIPSAKGIEGNIAKELGPEVESAGKSTGEGFGSNIASTIKKVLVAAGIGSAIKSAINLGGELEQNLGGTEAVFGEFAGTIQQTAQEAYKNMGLSASDYMATANVMGSLFQGSGIEQQKSLDMTAEAMQRAADVASVMGIDTQMAMDSIAGAAKGNFTMMDNLGVAMNATTLQAYALEEGINFDWNTASNAEKSELAMKMFMDRTTQYAGNFARESEETFSGSLGAMQASFQDLLGNLATGQDIGPALGALGQTIVTFAQNLLPMISDVVSQAPSIIVNLFSTAGPQLVEAGMEAIAGIASGIGGALPDLIPQAVEAVMSIVETFLDNIPMLIDSGLQLLTGLVEGIMQAVPVLVEKAPGIIDSLIAALLESIPLIIQAGIDLLTALVDALPEIIETIVEVLPEIIDSVINTLLENLPLIIQAGVDLLTALIENLPTIILTIVNAMPQIIEGITGAILDNIPLIISTGVDLLTSLITDLPKIILELIAAMPEIVLSMVDAIGEGLEDFVDIGADLIRGLWRGIVSVKEWIMDKISGFVDSIIGGVRSFFGIASPSKVFAGIGGDLGAGLAKGISDSGDLVSSAMDDLSRLATGSFESDLAINSSIPSGSMRLSPQETNRDLLVEQNRLLKAILAKDTNAYIDGDILVDYLQEPIDERTGFFNREKELAVGGAY